MGEEHKRRKENKEHKEHKEHNVVSFAARDVSMDAKALEYIQYWLRFEPVAEHELVSVEQFGAVNIDGRCPKLDVGVAHSVMMGHLRMLNIAFESFAEFFADDEFVLLPVIICSDNKMYRMPIQSQTWMKTAMIGVAALQNVWQVQPETVFPIQMEFFLEKDDTHGYHLYDDNARYHMNLIMKWGQMEENGHTICDCVL